MEAFDRFLASYPSRSYVKGEIVMSIDETPVHAFAIRQGIIKTYNIDGQGNEHPVVFDVPVEIFPIGWVLGHIETTAYFYEAFSDCVLTHFDRDDFNQAMASDSKLAVELYQSLGQRFLGLQQRIEALEQPRAAHKVLFTLRYLCSRFGHQVGSSTTVDMDLPFTQQDIANFIGLTRETTAIELKRLERDGIISYQRQHYVVRMSKLQDLVDEA